MNVEIAQRLAELRRERGFSQEGLAEQLGLSRQAVSKWERAESAPDMGNLIALADLYEVTLDELLRVSPEVEEDMRFESQERAESVETEAAAAAEAALAAAARAERSGCNGQLRFRKPKVVVEVSAPAARREASAACSVPGQVGAPAKGRRTGFAPSTYGAPGHRLPSAGYGPGASSHGSPASPQSPGSYPSGSCPPGSIPPASSVPIAPPPPPRPKDPLQSFPYPLLCAVIFLLAGFCFGWWHPGWVIFLTIPFYYWVVNTLEADPAYQTWLAERQSVAAKSDSSSEGGAQ
ncbi:MAG: helix-turn-helix domain-containing protein [Adlercreutzia equolifaciens]